MAGGLVDRATALALVEQRLTAGYTGRALSRTMGANADTVGAFLRGSGGMRRSTFDALAMTPPAPTTMPEGSRVPAWPSTRRLRALAAVGHTNASLVAETGLSLSSVKAAINGAHPWVEPGTARRVGQAWERLAREEPQPPTWRARRHRWKRPWDWHDIDDPSEPDIRPAGQVTPVADLRPARHASGQ